MTAPLLVTLTVLLRAIPASAQHHTAGHAAAPHASASHASGSTGHAGSTQAHMSSQERQMMQQEQKQMQQMQRQMAHQMQLHQQAMMKEHQAHMKQFQEWMHKQNANVANSSTNTNGKTRANGSTNANGNSNGAHHDLPHFESPEHLHAWLKQQAHLRALKKTTHPAYEHYLAYQRYTSLQPTIANLQSSMQLLSGLNSDYAGHRTRAVQHIGSALSSLGANAATVTPIVGGAGNLTPATASQHVRQALTKLRSSASHLSRVGNSSARSSVQSAIAELNSALALR